MKVRLLEWLEIMTFNPSHPNSGRREKINLDFYFHTSLWCFERIYKFSLIFILIKLETHEVGWVKQINIRLPSPRLTVTGEKTSI